MTTDEHLNRYGIPATSEHEVYRSGPFDRRPATRTLCLNRLLLVQKITLQWLLVAVMTIGKGPLVPVNEATAQEHETRKRMNKMKVEVWSDVVCPFCYIGKAHFDKGLEQFDNKENIAFEWKSFQLYPNLKTDPDRTLYEHLSNSKGITVDQAKAMALHAARMGKDAGLDLNFDRCVVANSFNAHRLVHFARSKGLQQEMKARLFAAYFTEGRNIDDPATLISLASDIGLMTDETRSVLENNTYADAVRADIAEAQQLGVRGVPFFVFDRKYAVSGAQPPEAFLETLEKAFSEWRKENPSVPLQVSEGASCMPDRQCD